MNTNENILKEYDYLKNEINQKIELHNNLLTFTITTVVAILSITLGLQNLLNPLLFLMPFCILIPMSIRIAYYRFAMAKLSAYIIIFLEDEIQGMKWETRNREVRRYLNNDKKSIDIKLISGSYYECFILCILCYTFYVYSYCTQRFFSINLITMINIIWPLLLLVFDGYITIKIDSVDKNKEFWIRKWKKLKEEEQN